MALPTRDLRDCIGSDIDIAPMIDVLLVLFVVFLFAQAIVRQAGPVGATPVAANPVPITVVDPVVLDLTGAGLFINGQPVPNAQLQPQLRAIYGRRASKVLFIRPATDRSTRQVNAAIDRARSAGIDVTALLPIAP